MEKKLLTALTLSILSGAAVALPTYYDFQALDANKDGYLDNNEYQNYSNSLQKQFGEADHSGDNKVSLDEFKVSSKIQIDPLMNKALSGAAVSTERVSGASSGSADTSGSSSGSTGSANNASNTSSGASGSASGSASSSGSIATFESLDTDQNGKLSRSEYEAAASASGSASTNASSGGDAGKQVRGAELMGRDKDKAGMESDKVMDATNPTVIQGGEGGNAPLSQQPSSSGSSDSSSSSSQ